MDATTGFTSALAPTLSAAALTAGLDTATTAVGLSCDAIVEVMPCLIGLLLCGFVAATLLNARRGCDLLGSTMGAYLVELTNVACSAAL